MRWVKAAREQLHVQLAQGYGPVVILSGRARYLGAEPDVRVPPVHQRRGAAEDGPVGVDQEPLDGCREGLDETGLHVVGTWGLAIGFVQGGLQVLHGVLLDLCPGPFRDPGDMAAEDCLETWEVHRSLTYSSRQKARAANITSWASVRSVRVLVPARSRGLTGPGPLPLWLPARLSIAGQCRGRGGARSP